MSGSSFVYLLRSLPALDTSIICGIHEKVNIKQIGIKRIISSAVFFVEAMWVIFCV